MSSDTPSEVHLKLRNLTAEDYPQLSRLMDAVYPDLGGSWPEESIMRLIREFPEGQIAIEDHGKLVAAALCIRCDYDRFSRQHTYEDLIGRREQFIHNKEGDALYGMDLFVDAEYRDLRLGRRLYDARKDLCRDLNLRAILAGGRITNYHKQADQMSPSEYIEAVDRKELHDPILSFQLANDFEVKRLLKGYMPEDKKSQGYATLLEWNNILYEPETSDLSQRRKTVIRVGILQWQMRLTGSFEAWLSQVEYFVDTMADYQADFVLFPEFFNAPLMGLDEHKNQFDAIRFLSTFAERTIEALSEFAITYNINIIAGSIPEMEGEVLYNKAYLCRRDGTVDAQAKLHITPHERRDWVIEGGDKLQVF
ncbi:MAG: nitrilase-related carbon-nitrogen hydrolase, partial [Pseudomonadales bacterium]|nr:nitrilase-related carbon-nitrogen hydrolase [Pseudomonadales bacterium]